MWDMVLLANREGEIIWCLETGTIGIKLWELLYADEDVQSMKSALAVVLKYGNSQEIRCNEANWRFLAHSLHPHNPLILVQGIYTPGDIRSLTPRERETLALMGQYLTPKEISRQMHISVSTVEAHRRAIRRKLDVTHDCMLTAIAHRAGLCEDPMGHIINYLIRSRTTPSNEPANTSTK